MRDDKNHTVCHAKNVKNLLCKDVKNHATFVEGFWPEFYARVRFMKYSMSALCPYWNMDAKTTFITRPSFYLFSNVSNLPTKYQTVVLFASV